MPARIMPAIPGASTSIPTSPPTARRSITSRPSSRSPARWCCCRASPKSCAASSACRTGAWPSAAEGRRARSTSSRSSSRSSEHVDEESRKLAIARAHADRRSAARQRGHGRRPARSSDPALGLLMLGLIVVVIMMGFADGLHPDGPRHVLRLHRLLRPASALARQPASST